MCCSIKFKRNIFKIGHFGMPSNWESNINMVVLRSLRRTDHSLRGVLPTVARRCV